MDEHDDDLEPVVQEGVEGETEDFEDENDDVAEAQDIEPPTGHPDHDDDPAEL